MKTQGLLVMVLLLTAHAHNAIVIRGLAVYGGSDEANFPLIINGRITIQFDVLAEHPPMLKARFYHCNRDWVIDKNLFVNDENRNTSATLQFQTSPNGVRGYNYRYVNSFPDGEFVRFEHSGNWIFRIMDNDLTTTYAEGRFFVAEASTPPSVVVTNDYLTANSFPYNQIHKLVVNITLPSEQESQYFTTVDVYQNRRIYNPYRIDAWDRDPYTKVDGFNTGKRLFSVRNIVPGNEYRTLDLSNTARYPNFQPAKNVEGADLKRQFWRTGRDRAGEAVLNKFTGLNSDYLEYLFRLDLTETDYRLATAGGREIFVVGAFNFWKPTDEDKLVYDETERSYVVRKLLRRGIYDYQYITGKWNATTHTVEQQDWTAIEGTDVRTTNVYTVFVYYNDPRFGGFDRIVGAGQGRSSGSADVGSN
jgi:hypothetical protein